MPEERIAVFDRTVMALMFERELKWRKIPVHIVPAPRRLSVSCGLACKFPTAREDDIKTICAAQGIEVAGFYDG